MSQLTDKWHSYLEEVVPTTAGVVQVEETKRAFYAGAAVALNIAPEELIDALKV